MDWLDMPPLLISTDKPDGALFVGRGGTSRGVKRDSLGLSAESEMESCSWFAFNDHRVIILT